MKLILGTIALFTIFFFSTLDWRRSIKSVFFLLVFEGVLRKWILPQASDLTYFLKDIVLLGAYIKFYFLSPEDRKFTVVNDFLKIVICLVAGWCIFQAFNPSLGSPIVGFFGLRGYIFYIPLMWIMPNLFLSEEELRTFLRSHILLVIPVGILGIVQFFQPGSVLNVYAGGVDPAAVFAGTDYLRITGTFSYISGYSVFLSICFALLIPIFIRENSLKWQILLAVAMALIIGNSLMTGSRGIIIFEIIFLVGYFALMLWQQPSLLNNYLKRFFAPIFVSFMFITLGIRPALDAFWHRASSSDQMVSRISDLFSVINYLQYKKLDGYGTGATHQAINSLRTILSLPRGEFIPTGFESEMGRITLELGPIGFLCWYLLRISLIIALGLLFLRLRKVFLKQLALAIFLVHIIHLPGQLVVNHTFLVYYWFLTGFIFLLPKLDKQEEFKLTNLKHNLLI